MILLQIQHQLNQYLKINKYHNIDISGKEIVIYINTKFREAKIVNSDKIINTESIFNFCDKERNIISQVYEYSDAEMNKK